MELLVTIKNKANDESITKEFEVDSFEKTETPVDIRGLIDKLKRLSI